MSQLICLQDNCAWERIISDLKQVLPHIRNGHEVTDFDEFKQEWCEIQKKVVESSGTYEDLLKNIKTIKKQLERLECTVEVRLNNIQNFIKTNMVIGLESSDLDEAVKLYKGLKNLEKEEKNLGYFMNHHFKYSISQCITIFRELTNKLSFTNKIIYDIDQYRGQPQQQSREFQQYNYDRVIFESLPQWQQDPEFGDSQIIEEISLLDYARTLHRCHQFTQKIDDGDQSQANNLRQVSQIQLDNIQQVKFDEEFSDYDVHYLYDHSEAVIGDSQYLICDRIFQVRDCSTLNVLIIPYRQQTIVRIGIVKIDSLNIQDRNSGVSVLESIYSLESLDRDCTVRQSTEQTENVLEEYESSEESIFGRQDLFLYYTTFTISDESIFNLRIVNKQLEYINEGIVVNLEDMDFYQYDEISFYIELEYSEVIIQ